MSAEQQCTLVIIVSAAAFGIACMFAGWYMFVCLVRAWRSARHRNDPKREAMARRRDLLHWGMVEDGTRGKG